jgi:hypothetical protein
MSSQNTQEQIDKLTVQIQQLEAKLQGDIKDQKREAIEKEIADLNAKIAELQASQG